MELSKSHNGQVEAGGPFAEENLVFSLGSLFLNKAVHKTLSTFPKLPLSLPRESSTNTRKNNFKQ